MSLPLLAVVEFLRGRCRGGVSGNLLLTNFTVGMDSTVFEIGMIVSRCGS
jgi:hypothetical protein